MKPLLNKHEIRTLERTLSGYGKEGRVVKVLEWGSGGSTVYFTRFMKERGIAYRWVSIEYNALWYSKVSEETKDDPSVSIVLFDVGNNSLRQRHIEMNEYVSYPSSLNEEFDLIFVDGRKRRRCVLEAKRMLSQDGTVFLHDAQRKHYQCAFAAYSDHRFVGVHLWQGTLRATSFVQKMRNKAQSFFFKALYVCAVKPFQFVRDHLVLKVRSTRVSLSCAADASSKMKVLYVIVLLALKKKGIGTFNRVVLSIRRTPPRGPFVAALSHYESAHEFCVALCSKESENEAD